MDVVRAVRELGGFATRRELIARGASVAQLAFAVRAGALRRPRRGWYTHLSPEDPRFRAVAIGGRLTGLSAIASLGGWVWDPPARIQVAVAHDASRIGDRRSRDDADVHWEPDSVQGSRSVVAVRDALIRVFLDADLESAIVAADWALHTGAIDQDAWLTVVSSLPEHLRWMTRLVDGRSESPLETVPRVRLLLLGFRVVPQHRFGASRRFDLLIEGVVALEADGRIHEATFESDRIRDLEITVEGHHCLRVTHRMIRERWPEIVAAIDAAVEARLGPRIRYPLVLATNSGRASRRAPEIGVSPRRTRTTPGVAAPGSGVAMRESGVAMRESGVA